MPLKFILAIVLSIGLFILLMIMAVLIHKIYWITWLAVPIFIFIMVKLALSIKGKLDISDTIEVDHKGFTSSYYGRVLYADIDCIAPYNAFGPLPPSMRIKLKSGKTIVWLFQGRDLDQKNVTPFVAFKDAMLDALSGYSAERQVNPGAPSHDRWDKKPISPGSTAEQAQSPAEESVDMEHRNQLKEALKRSRNRKLRYTAIPLSFGIALLGFVRTCGNDYIKKRNAKQAIMLRSAMANIELSYQEKLNQAKITAEIFTKKFGPVYAFSNDSNFKLQYLPEISDGYQPEALKHVYGIGKTKDIENLDKYLAHPDSAKYALLMYHTPTKEILRCNDYGQKDSLLPVYLIAYNPKKIMAANPFDPYDSTKVALTYCTSINIPKNQQITRKVLKNWQYESARTKLIQHPGTFFYLIAATKDSIPRQAFDSVRKMIVADLEKHDIDTVGFKNYAFNE